MNLCRREEIAIAVLVSCAKAGFERIRTDDAAMAAGASAVQTAQIVHSLMRAGLVETVRGKHGGIRLARKAAQISLGEVLRLVGSKRRGEPARPLHGDGPLAAIASAAEAQARQAFESFTIADLAAGEVGDKLACFQCDIRLGAARNVARSYAGAPPPGPAGMRLRA
jgi:Rrf2 family protein